MSRPYTYRAPNPMAKRAGVLLLALAGLATLLGVLTVTLAFNLHVLYQQPEMAERIDELKKQTGVADFKPFIIAYGIAILMYAAGAIVLGFVTRTGHIAALIVTLVLASLMTLFLSLIGIATLAMGSPLPLIAAAAHGLLVYWLVLALRQSTAPTTAVPTYQPMRDYYLPPAPPTASAV